MGGIWTMELIIGGLFPSAPIVLKDAIRVAFIVFRDSIVIIDSVGVRTGVEFVEVGQVL